MLADLANHNKKLTAAFEPCHLRTSSQLIQQINSDDMPIHIPMEALNFLARNLILEQQPITLNNLTTALLLGIGYI